MNRQVFFKKNNIYLKIFYLFILSYLLSCDPGSTIIYCIDNKLTRPIKIKYQFIFCSSNDTSIQEKIIESGTNKFLDYEIATGYIDYIDKNRDSMFFYQFVLEQNGKQVHRNFKDKKNWKLIKKNKQEATYMLIVDSTYFEK